MFVGPGFIAPGDDAADRTRRDCAHVAPDEREVDDLLGRKRLGNRLHQRCQQLVGRDRDFHLGRDRAHLESEVAQYLLTRSQVQN